MLPVVMTISTSSNYEYNIPNKNVEAEVDDDQEEAEMKKHVETVPDDEVAIDAIPLATKPLIIVDWKIIKEGKMGYFQIIRADRSSKRYSSMIQMLQNIDKEDLETLWKLVKAKHGIPYTVYNNPQGITYEDKYKRNRLMYTDELYKFSDWTLTSVRSVLHDIASNLRIDYLPKRRWSSLDRKSSCIMIKAIDKQLLEIRLMRSLEKFIGGRDYGEDLRLLQ
ncbi:hypothetical protein Tco_1306219 [Tanacetum coccineum]